MSRAESDALEAARGDDDRYEPHTERGDDQSSADLECF